MNSVLYGLMHFFVDLICAWAMLNCFRAGRGGYENLLIYNFCAFALQMPLGTLLDLLQNRAGENRRRYAALFWAVSGGVLTAAGALIHPAVLGLGNALFHVGSGMDVIREDFRRNRKGKDLGIFVAPGAIGLYIGGQIGSADWVLVLLFAAAVLIPAVFLLVGKRYSSEPAAVCREVPSGRVWILGLCCFAVVILRSFAGLSVNFSWKTGMVPGALAVMAVALGKMSGGFLSARFGMGRTMGISLLLATLCFLFSGEMVFGLAALLLFNMSMPVTLYMLARVLPDMPGFAFGILTFGLFLGFLPVYAGADLPLTGQILGAAASVVSAVLLAAGRKSVEDSHVFS